MLISSMPNKLKPKGMVCLTNTHAILKKKSRWDIRLIEYFLEYFFSVFLLYRQIQTHFCSPEIEHITKYVSYHCLPVSDAVLSKTIALMHRIK